MKKMFHFLGGIHFAIFLIATSACLVIIATVLESLSDSHLYAAEWIYHHPLFLVLLGLFFINILFSSLRRWPFQKKHIPFLITHLGLLMILAGTMIKQKWGLQGNLNVWEGSGSQTVSLPNTYALHVFNRDENSPIDYKIINYLPHAEEVWETWIKGDVSWIRGFPPIPVQKEDDPFLQSVIAPNSWSILALITSHLQTSLEKSYMEGLILRLSENAAFFEIPLQEAIQAPFLWKGITYTCQLQLNYGANGFENSQLILQHGNEKNWINLQGARSLYTQGSGHLNMDLIRPLPSLLITKQGDSQTLFAFDKHGRVHAETFKKGAFKTLIIYDDGFGGYAVQAKIPFPSFPSGRLEKELADSHLLRQQLKKLQKTLAPPLLLFKKGCEKAHIDFSTSLVAFLKTGHTQAQLNWNDLPASEQKACRFASWLLEDVPDSQIVSLFEKKEWPFLQELKTSNDPRATLIQQIFSLSHYLPETQVEGAMKCSELSIYLSAYGIDANLLLPIEDEKETFERLEEYFGKKAEEFVLETPLTLIHRPSPPLLKKEEERPALLLSFEGRPFSIGYDASGMGMKWPLPGGAAMVRFQSKTIEIPYRIRLRQARQINYPQSEQPNSYEADVLITDQGGKTVETTLRMNQVHETDDGYRFYLAGISAPPDEPKRIQIIVNHDPIKYVLTYPGAILVVLGTLLLFYPKRRETKDA